MTEHKPRGVLAFPADADDRHVNMTNRLARSAQSLDLGEKRLMAMGIAGTDSVPAHALKVGENQGWKLRITAHDYAETFGLDPSVAYKQMKEACDQLFERQVSYTTLGPRGKPSITRLRWVSSAKYTESQGLVELNFSPEVAPHLLGLRSQFTSYRLSHAASFDSVYAWRLFEILKSWQSTGLYKTSVEEFWEAMEAPPSCRKNFKELRTRIIEPSVQAIVATAGMTVEWRPIKFGARRVNELEFKFEANPQNPLFG